MLVSERVNPGKFHLNYKWWKLLEWMIRGHTDIYFGVAVGMFRLWIAKKNQYSKRISASWLNLATAWSYEKFLQLHHLQLISHVSTNGSPTPKPWRSFFGGREKTLLQKPEKTRDFVGDLLIPAFMLCFLPDLQVDQRRNHQGWLEMGDGMRKKYIGEGGLWKNGIQLFMCSNQRLEFGIHHDFIKGSHCKNESFGIWAFFWWLDLFTENVTSSEPNISNEFQGSNSFSPQLFPYHLPDRSGPSQGSLPKKFDNHNRQFFGFRGDCIHFSLHPQKITTNLFWVWKNLTFFFPFYGGQGTRASASFSCCERLGAPGNPSVMKNMWCETERSGQMIRTISTTYI